MSKADEEGLGDKEPEFNIKIVFCCGGLLTIDWRPPLKELSRQHKRLYYKLAGRAVGDKSETLSGEFPEKS